MQGFSSTNSPRPTIKSSCIITPMVSLMSPTVGRADRTPRAFSGLFCPVGGATLGPSPTIGCRGPPHGFAGIWVPGASIILRPTRPSTFSRNFGPRNWSARKQFVPLTCLFFHPLLGALLTLSLNNLPQDKTSGCCDHPYRGGHLNHPHKN